MDEDQDQGPEISDVNHYDARVWIRFENGDCVTLTAKQVLEAARGITERTGNGHLTASSSARNLNGTA